MKNDNTYYGQDGMFIYYGVFSSGVKVIVDGTVDGTEWRPRRTLNFNFVPLFELGDEE